MKFEHAQRYRLDTRTDSYTVIGPDGVPHFTAPATTRIPKLYVISLAGVPGYIGITSQSVSSRLRFGLRAIGQHGYHGYRWRNQRSLALDIWCLTGAPSNRASIEIKSIEAEVVFLIRQQFDQWPEFQTEIHFYPSKSFHRDAAARVLRHLAATPRRQESSVQ